MHLGRHLQIATPRVLASAVNPKDYSEVNEKDEIDEIDETD